jgi:glutamate racemase
MLCLKKTGCGKLNKIIYGIIAGTLIDTELGAEFFAEQGLKVAAENISEKADVQNNLQYSNPKKLEKITIEKVNNLKKSGADIIIIYCNSLSAVLDTEKIAALTKIPIITPLDVYKNLGLQEFDKLAVLAANSQSAAKIENIISKKNQQLEFITAGIMPIINAVEDKIAPAEILSQYGLRKMLISFKEMGADSILLGCTHLPYLKEEINNIFENIIDPADKLIILAEEILENQ